MAVEEGELLLAVSRIIGGVEVERDQPATLPEAIAVAFDHRVGEGVRHAEQVCRLNRVLEARQRGLRRQRLSMDRVSIHQQLVHRIVCQFACIVAVRVPQRDRKDPLLNQLPERVRDLSRFAWITQAVGQRFGQPELPIDTLQQHTATVRAAVLLR